MLNLLNQPAIRYFLFRCWLSGYTAMPDLDGGQNGVAIEILTLQVEGWERDFRDRADETPEDAMPLTGWSIADAEAGCIDGAGLRVRG